MNRLGLGLVGLNFGEKILEREILNGSAREFFELKAVCDVDDDKLSSVSKKYNVRSYNNIQGLLCDAEIDAVALFTGPVGRAALIERCLNYGKHVMTTKPFEQNSKLAEAVLKRAYLEKKAVFMNSPGPLWSPDIRIIKEWQKEYDLGIPVAARWETWCSYREEADGTWYDDPELCPVPPIFRLGIYAINDMIQLLGQIDSVSVMESRIFTKRPTSDIASLNLKFCSGALGNIHASFCVDDRSFYPDNLTLNFERGTVYRRDSSNGSFLLRVDTKNGVEDERIATKPIGAAYQWDAFYRYITGGTIAEETSYEDLVHGLQVIEAMSKASAINGTVKVSS